MRGHIYLGSSGWAYSSWKPDFYPPAISSKKFLAYYATRLNTVEVNYTFRSLPSSRTVESWLLATAPNFRFSFKAPQRITHILRLKDCAESMNAFVHSIQPVAEAKRLGIVLLQLAPNFKADEARLESFLSEAVPSNLRIALEFRHESWFSDATYSVLRQYGAALCMAESDELVTPDVETAPFACYRFRRSSYSPKELEKIRALLLGRAKIGDVFAYFKHEEEPTGALHAACLLEELHHS